MPLYDAVMDDSYVVRVVYAHYKQPGQKVKADALSLSLVGPDVLRLWSREPLKFGH